MACRVFVLFRPRIEQYGAGGDTVSAPDKCVGRVSVDALAQGDRCSWLPGKLLVEAGEQAVLIALAWVGITVGGGTQQCGGDASSLTPEVPVPYHDEVAAR